MTSNGDPNRDLDPANDAKLVHEARKAVKRMRALARLQREEIGEEEFQRVNSSLRDMGRRLAGARDAEVRLATLVRLTNRHPKKLALEGVARLRVALESDRKQAPPLGTISQQRVLADVADMRRELSRWNLLDHDLQTLLPGLRRIYREGRRRYERARHHHARPQDLHDWRKRVKALYYVLDMLGGANAKGVSGITKRTERLGEVLGEEHDLWMLSVYVEEHPQALGRGDRSQEVLLKLISKQRQRLRERAFAGGARIYADPAGKFTRRVGQALSH
ncbi:MAG: CHAD domain-containing protein [Solirubrobacteraceae bacterium]